MEDVNSLTTRLAKLEKLLVDLQFQLPHNKELQATFFGSEVHTQIFTKDEAGDLIRKFWKPDGRNINRKNQQAIRNWLTKNNINEPSITFFLRSELFAHFRNQFVADLNLN